MPEAVACERCGTFAELRSDGFKSWCQACWSSSSQLIDHPLTTTRSLFDALLQLLRQHFLFAFTVTLVFRTVPALAFALLHVDAIISTICLTVGATIAELLVLSVVFERSVLQRPTVVWPVIRARVRRGFWRTAVTNLGTGLLATLGLMCCFVPGFIAAALLNPALPIALYEDQHTARAVELSFERTRHHWGQLTAVLTPIMLASILPTVVVLFVSVVLWQGKPPDDAKLIYSVSDLLVPVLAAPSYLLQVVFWAATRPR